MYFETKYKCSSLGHTKIRNVRQEFYITMHGYYFFIIYIYYFLGDLGRFSLLPA